MTSPRATIHEIPRGHSAGSTTPGTAATATPARPATRNGPGTHDTVRRFVRDERSSFGYAFQGIAYSWRTQRHLRVHASIAAVCIGLGLLLGLRPTEWAALVAMIALVTALEMLNTVVEVIVDMVSPDYHPSAKVAKDVAAGTVLVAALGAVLVGIFIFLPRLLALIH
jgi:diacylglycerol kinase